MDAGGSREVQDWLGIEEASPFLGKQTKKSSVGWTSVANAVVVALIMAMPPILLIFTGRLDAPAVWIKSTVAGLGVQPAESKKDMLLGGLLLPGFDEGSCASRYQSVYYRSNMTRSPSPYLITRLRRQEALQRRCGPGTDPYTRATERLKSGQKNVDTVDGCGYLVLVSYRGLGNRILATVSAFLYALLTDRVLLVDRMETFGDLFCEPFPGATTWLLPLDFPLEGYRDLWEGAAETYENVTLHNNTGPASEHRFVYLHLDHLATQANRLVYCDDHRQFLHRVQWVFLRTDGYIAPSFFLNPVYREELDLMFPQKDSVFYVLSRYLLHPSNDVWGMVTRFYDSYLKNADERLGIQIRVFDEDRPHQYILDQILACTSQEHLLPETISAGAPPPPTAGARAPRSKAVLTTGLSGWYGDSIRDMYWQSTTATGELLSVHQPSHEEHQSMFRVRHDMKALAEMYLLSMTDKIVTSGWSTFGYVGTALGGLTPYIMMRPENRTVPDPPCKRAMSMEPCGQVPAFFECTRKEYDVIIDNGRMVPHVRACEDMPWGLKLTEPIAENT